MKKQELLNYFDDELLEKLYSFCYARTNDSYEAQDLCSDIIFALVKAAKTKGEIENMYSYIWKIARNEDIIPYIADEKMEDDSDELLGAVYRRISFLTKAYREVMILFYIEGLSTAQIAERLNSSEVAVRQRLFSARKKVKSEVEEMAEFCNRPVLLDKIDYNLWGTGDPFWGDPREVCTRQFSRHIVWLCRKKAMSATEIASELNVPTVYVEEELEILTKGTNGEYGLLLRLENGKYAINFVLFDKDVMEAANKIDEEQMPKLCNIISEFIEQHKEAYLAFPYLNKKVDLNRILWQQIYVIAGTFSDNVSQILEEKFFSQIQKAKRPFNVFGFVDNGQDYGAGWDGLGADNVCGYTKINLDNIYITRIKPHFHCGLNVASDTQIQLALRAIEGLDINSLSELEKEHAAKAIDCGYLYRDGEILYTKILVSDRKDMDRLFDISKGLRKGYFELDAEMVAEKIAELIRRNVPDYLLGEWEFANVLAGLPVLDALVEVLIEKGVLVPPEDGIGAEGCWMSVEK